MTPAQPLPPSTALLNAAINDPAISDAEFRSYSRLYALAWRYDYQRTDPLDYETEVIPLIGSHGTARRHMNNLRTAGYLDWTTNGAHQYVFTFPSPTFGTREPEPQPAAADPSPKSGTPGTTFGTQDPDLSPNFGTSSPKIGTPGTKNGTRKTASRAPVPVGSKVGIGEDRLINLINLNILPNLPSDARLEKILTATQILFDGESLYRPTRPVTFFFLLAHLAQAYHEHTRGVRPKPARAAFNRIKRGWKPEPAYLADPFVYLPPEFLAAAGLEAFIPATSSLERAEDVPEQDAGDPPPEPEADPSVLEPVRPDGLTAGHVWDQARDQMQADIPKSAYDTYVRPTLLERYQDGIFWVRAADAYARDWLQSRMQRTFERVLAGMCNRQVAICFVVEGGDRSQMQ